MRILSESANREGHGRDFRIRVGQNALKYNVTVVTASLLVTKLVLIICISDVFSSKQSRHASKVRRMFRFKRGKCLNNRKKYIYSDLNIMSENSDVRLVDKHRTELFIECVVFIVSRY